MAGTQNDQAALRFLGLTDYYRKFVVNYGIMAFLLTQQLNKGIFKWNKEPQQAFEELKEAMMKVPILGLPNFKQPFEVESDASGVGVGAILMQHHRPIAFFSHALPPTQCAKAVYERELIAIVFAIQKWRPYLLGRRFTVQTDQKSLKFLPEQKWVAKLLAMTLQLNIRVAQKTQQPMPSPDFLQRWN